MFSHRLWYLFVLLAGLTFCQPAEAQKSWPVDTSGVPAPPCTTFDPVTNVVIFCPPSGGSPAGAVSSNSSAFGQGFYTGVDTANLLNSGASYLFLDETTVIGVSGRNVGAANIYRSNDGGRTMTTVTAGAGSVPANNALRNLIRTANGLYVVGTNNNPMSVFISRDLGTFTNFTSGVPAGGPGNIIMYQASNTVLLTEDATNNVCRTTANAAGTSLNAFTCAVPPTWTGAFSAGFTIGMFHLAPSTGAGTASGIWIGADKASPANIIRSTNDGVSFTSVTTLAAGTAGSAISVKCLSNAPATCLIANSGIIYRSTDAGLTWASVASYNATQSPNLGHAILDYNNGTLVVVGTTLSTATASPGCPPACGYGNTLWARSTDSGVTWTLINGGWGQTAGAGGDAMISAVTSPTSGRAIVSLFHLGQGVPGGSGSGTAYIYGPTIPPGSTTTSGNQGGTQLAIGASGEQFFAGPIQSGTVANSQTTGGATTAVTTTLTGVIGFRWHIYSIEARCNTGAATTAGVSMTDAATTVWSTGATDVPGGTVNYRRPWTPGYTTTLPGTTVVITLAACTAGTGTLIVQADLW